MNDRFVLLIVRRRRRMLDDVGFALHVLHLAILAFGAVGVWLMLRPTLGRGRTVSALRAQAEQGTLAQAALRRAIVGERLPIARATRTVRLLRAYSVAGVAVVAAVLVEHAIGVEVSAWSAGAVLVVALAVCTAYFGRPRPAEQVVLLAVAGEWLVHAVLVFAGAGAGGGVSRVLTAVLFCHPVGVSAPRVTALGYVTRPSSVSVSTSGLFLVGCACLVTAAVAGMTNLQATRAAWARAGVGVAPRRTGRDTEPDMTMAPRKTRGAIGTAKVLSP